MRDYWSYAILKEWKKDIYQKCLTHDDYMGRAQAEFYETVLKITDGVAVNYEIPEQARKIVRMRKGNNKWLLPVIYEEQLPVVVKEWIECQLKPSDKTVFKFATDVKSMHIPEDRCDKTFKQFITELNPVQHTEPKHFTFLKILAIASKYKSVKCCVCSEPGTGKNSNFMVMHHILDRSPRLSGPTPARLYQVIVNNDVVVIDELTSIKSDMVREIEGMVLQLGDNSTEYMKHSQAVGRQLKEADLVKKSIVFTYNRPIDVGKKATFFDDKWNNPAAFKSRYPQFLLKGTVVGDAPVYSYAEIKEKIKQHGEEIKQTAKQLSYWVANLNQHLHNWDKSKLQIKGRHKTNLSGLIDALDAYAETQEEFDDWCLFINQSLDDYKAMIKGTQEDTWEQDQGFNKGTLQ